MFKFVRSITKSVFKGAKEGIKEEVKENPQFQKVIKKHPKTFHFVKRRLSKREKYGLYFSTGSLIFLTATYFFAKILFGYVNHNALVSLDIRALNIVKFFRNPALNQDMFFWTNFEKWEVVVMGLVLTTIFLVYLGLRYYSYLLIISVSFGELFVWFSKNLIERARPDFASALITEKGYSFPSGHAFVAMSFYGLLGYIIFSNIKRKSLKAITLIFFTLFILGIGFSRIYLGVHWFSDVLASLVGGIAWICVLVMFLKTKKRFGSPTVKEILIPEKRDNSKNTFLLLVLLLVVWLAFAFYFFKTHSLPFNSGVTEQANDFGGVKERIVISEQDFPGKIFENLPRVSETITGKPMEPINLIVAGSREELFSSFEKAGWFPTDRLNLKNAWRLVIKTLFNQPYGNAPGIPSLWNALPNEIGFAKPTEKNQVQERNHLHFWETSFSLSDGRSVWIGTAHFDKTIKKTASVILPVHVIDPAIDKERDKIKADLLLTGRVESSKEFQIVEPTLGQNQSGDMFFTDGKAEVIYLR